MFRWGRARPGDEWKIPFCMCILIVGRTCDCRPLQQRFDGRLSSRN